MYFGMLLDFCFSNNLYIIFYMINIKYIKTIISLFKKGRKK